MGTCHGHQANKRFKKQLKRCSGECNLLAELPREQTQVTAQYYYPCLYNMVGCHLCLAVYLAYKATTCDIPRSTADIEKNNHVHVLLRTIFLYGMRDDWYSQKPENDDQQGRQTGIESFPGLERHFSTTLNM
eukprot:4872220-Amphidinium_carterae.1